MHNGRHSFTQNGPSHGDSGKCVIADAAATGGGRHDSILRGKPVLMNIQPPIPGKRS
jgi:hypothetical protein